MPQLGYIPERLGKSSQANNKQYSVNGLAHAKELLQKETFRKNYLRFVNAVAKKIPPKTLDELFNNGTIDDTPKVISSLTLFDLAFQAVGKDFLEDTLSFQTAFQHILNQSNGHLCRTTIDLIEIETHLLSSGYNYTNLKDLKQTDIQTLTVDTLANHFENIKLDPSPKTTTQEDSIAPQKIKALIKVIKECKIKLIEKINQDQTVDSSLIEHINLFDLDETKEPLTYNRTPINTQENYR